VVSVWKDLPSTLPLKITDRRRLTGNSGLVIFVGFENVGAVMSSRLLSGANGSLSRPAATNWARVGCGIVLGAEAPSLAGSPLLHAAMLSAAQTPDTISANRIGRMFRWVLVNRLALGRIRHARFRSLVFRPRPSSAWLDISTPGC